MKTFLLLISACSLTFLPYAQSNNPSVKKLVDQYAAIYQKTDPKENFFIRMSTAANNVFLVDNQPVFKAIESVRKNSGITVDSSVNLIYDSLISSFSREHLWDDHPGQQEKYMAFFKMYNSFLCPCLTEKIDQLKIREDSAMNSCVAKVISDTSYLVQARKLIGQVTMDELQNMSLLSGIYIFQNCSVMYRYFTESIRYESVYRLLGDLKDWFFRLDKKIIEMYSAKSRGLAKTFPTYKSFENELKLSASMLKIKRISNFHDTENNADGSLTIVNTYYSDTDNKRLLQGQIILKIKDPFFTAPVISWRHLPAGKITDADKYLQRIEDEQILEPPPMQEELKEIKIDTLKKK